MILPYMEQGNAVSDFDWKLRVLRGGAPNGKKDLIKLRVPTYICPSIHDLSDRVMPLGTGRSRTIAGTQPGWRQAVKSPLKGLRFRDVHDGLSNTAMIGEKHLFIECKNRGPIQANSSCGDGTPWIHLPWARNTFQRNLNGPLGRGPNDNVTSSSFFGSWQPDVCPFVFCDGSVHAISVTTSRLILGNLADRRDGQPVALP